MASSFAPISSRKKRKSNFPFIQALIENVMIYIYIQQQQDQKVKMKYTEQA